jgi:protein-L-isoaspartate(D-aspartate) O-methyltransferase
MNFEQARYNMIEQQLRPWKVLDPDVLDVLHVVKREEFVPAAHRRLAFADTEIVAGQWHLDVPPQGRGPCPAGAGDEETRKRA